MEKVKTHNKTGKYRQRVYQVLIEQNFIIGNEEKKIIKERTSNERRYFFMVAKRVEGKKIVERFIKIPENNSKKILVPFQRQIEMAKYLSAKQIIKTRNIIASNYNPKKEIPFVIMETFPRGHSKIGFIENNKGVELLGVREAQYTINQIKKFHSISIKSLPPKLRKNLKVYSGDYKNFRQKIFKYLNKKVRPLDKRGKPEIFHDVLERRIGIINLKNKVRGLLTKLEPIIDSRKNQSNSIVHGDMAPNNLYIFDSGDVELLDLEWVGISKNKALAMIIDFGNLRARSWSNKKFRKALDVALIKTYRAQKQEELGKAIVQLSILRSHIQLSGYFENYKQEKQKDSMQTRRRNSTERDILQIFSK
jgi:thiamine kinase-like enzyme